MTHRKNMTLSSQQSSSASSSPHGSQHLQVSAMPGYDMATRPPTKIRKTLHLPGDRSPGSKLSAIRSAHRSRGVARSSSSASSLIRSKRVAGWPSAPETWSLRSVESGLPSFDHMPVTTIMPQEETRLSNSYRQLPVDMAYGNEAFLPDSTEELVLNPATLRPKGRDDGEVDEDDAFVDEMVVIERPIYSQKDFDQGFEGGKRPQRTARSWLKAKAAKQECSCSCVRRFFASHLPFLRIMKEYSVKADLMADLIAGLTVGIMHIPQGMAYGQLSTLPPVYGLYVSFFPVILYFFLGTSKHISMGTFAVVSLMVGSAVDKGLKDNNIEPQTWNVTVGSGQNATYKLMDNSEEIILVKLKLAMAVTFAVGILQFLLGVLRLGFLTVYLSDPLISGFTTGAACHVFTSQVKHIFGISMNRYSGPFKLIYSYRDIFTNLPNTNAVTFIASLLCMALLFITKEYINNNPRVKPYLKMPIPVELIVVALGTIISYFVKLEEKYEVKIVGDVPVGIPSPNLYAFPYLMDMISSSFAIAIVAFAISVSMAKIFAKKHEYFVDSNQELLAYGLCNVASSFFSSFVATASLSRSLVQENVGGRTQMTGLVSSALLLVVLLFIGPYFQSLPNCILAAIIMVALKGMFKQFLELKHLWNISIIDFAVWLVTFAATVLLDVDWGLLVGVVFALLTVIIRSQRPYSCLLGQVPGTDIYKDINVYKAAEQTPNIKIFRFDSALFFANSEFFRSSLYKLTVDPNDLKKKERKLMKKKRKEEKELLSITMDPLGSCDIQEVGTSNVDPNPTSSNIPRDGDVSNDDDLNGVSNINQDDEETGDRNVVKTLPTLTDIHYVVLDCSTMSYVDSVGVKVLQQIMTELRAYDITVYLAQCKSGVREMFERTDFYNTRGKHFLFVTIHDAVVSAQLHQWSITGENNPLTSSNNNTNSRTINGVQDATDGNDGREQTNVESRDDASDSPDAIGNHSRPQGTNGKAPIVDRTAV